MVKIKILIDQKKKTICLKRSFEISWFRSCSSMSHAGTNVNSRSRDIMVSTTWSLAQCTDLWFDFLSNKVRKKEHFLLRYGIGSLGIRLCICWNDTSRTVISWWMWNRSIATHFSVKHFACRRKIEEYFCFSSLLGTPTISEWPEIAQCLYYQTGLPRFPLDDVRLSRLPMSSECRQFLKVKDKQKNKC